MHSSTIVIVFSTLWFFQRTGCVLIPESHPSLKIHIFQARKVVESGPGPEEYSRKIEQLVDAF